MGAQGMFFSNFSPYRTVHAPLSWDSRSVQSKTEHLQKLHWLKVPERIQFKILLMVFKCINGLAPSYLSDLISYNNISGSRAPSLYVTIPQSLVGERAFICYSGRIWNELPANIRAETDVLKFKSLLKTYLFKRSFNI